MNTQSLLAALSLAASLLLVVIGFLNFSVFLRQLKAAREQIAMAMRQLEVAQDQPELQLIQRAITETTDHLRPLLERPYLRPYFYEDRAWAAEDRASRDEVRVMAELILNNFASALMHSAAFPRYPVGSVDQTITFHLRHSPALREQLCEAFDRFPITGLSLLCLKNRDAAGVEADLRALIDGAAPEERARREQALALFRQHPHGEPLAFTRQTLEQARVRPRALLQR